MFQSVGHEPQRSRLIRRALSFAWTSRLLRLGVAILVALAIGVALYASSMARRSFSSTCDTWDAVDYDIAHVIDLKRRKTTYQESAEQDAELALDGDEVTFLLRDTLPYQVRTRFDGSEARADVAYPVQGGCYNVHYRGGVAVDDGVAVVTPSELVIGEADVTWLVAGRRFVLRPEDLPDPTVAEQLGNVERLEIEQSEVRLRLHDVWRMW